MKGGGDLALHETGACLVVAVQRDLDELEAEALAGRVLERIARARLHTLIVDLTGVPVVDLALAGQLEGLARAARLMGARALLSGLRPGPAAALARLGFAPASLEIAADLDAALGGGGR